MTFLLLIAVLIFAALEWFFEYKQNQRGIYFTKPAVMLLLIAWVWFSVDVSHLMTGLNTAAVLWFLLGLFMCLLGDIFLMFMNPLLQFLLYLLQLKL